MFVSGGSAFDYEVIEASYVSEPISAVGPSNFPQGSGNAHEPREVIGEKSVVFIELSDEIYYYSENSNNFAEVIVEDLSFPIEPIAPPDTGGMSMELLAEMFRVAKGKDLIGAGSRRLVYEDNAVIASVVAINELAYGNVLDYGNR